MEQIPGVRIIGNCKLSCADTVNQTLDFWENSMSSELRADSLGPKSYFLMRIKWVSLRSRTETGSPQCSHRTSQPLGQGEVIVRGQPGL